MLLGFSFLILLDKFTVLQVTQEATQIMLKKNSAFKTWIMGAAKSEGRGISQNVLGKSFQLKVQIHEKEVQGKAQSRDDGGEQRRHKELPQNRCL